MMLTAPLPSIFPVEIVSSRFVQNFAYEKTAQFLLMLGLSTVFVRGCSALSEVSSDTSPLPLYIPPHRR